MKKLLAGLAVALVATTAVRAEGVRASPEDAQDLVKTAVSYLKKQGPEKAYREFQNKNGAFVYKDLYVAVYDVAGKCLAHGAVPAKAGKALPEQPEADQKIIRARLAAIQGKSEAWQEYVYRNPATGKEETKVAYTEKVGDLLVSAGAYKAGK